MNQETKERIIAKFKQRIAEMKQKREERDRNHLDMISSRPNPEQSAINNMLNNNVPS